MKTIKIFLASSDELEVDNKGAQLGDEIAKRWLRKNRPDLIG